ncbi:MAG TPA: PadR family transcriptional regulator [Gaiellaceae bacterium]|nr:PadR family transcriptional regulator [Gaiellaceae bacterium]
MSNLTPTAKVILGLLRFGPQSGYDMRRNIEMSTRFFWGASYGQIYPELRRLEAQGLVEVEHGDEGGRRRRAYRLTPAGKRVLAEWLEADSHLFQYRDEGLLRLFFGDFTDRETALANIRRMREWRAEAIAFFRAEIEPLARGDVEAGYVFTHRALEFGIAMLETQAAWLAGLESELDDS